MAVDMRKTLEYVDEQIKNLTEIRAGLVKLLSAAGTMNTSAISAKKKPMTPAQRRNLEKAWKARSAQAKARRAMTRPPKGETKRVVTEVLQSGPLSLGELYEAAVRAGWKTTSATPKSNFGVLLQKGIQDGWLRKVGGDYELAPVTLPAENEVIPEETLASA